MREEIKNTKKLDNKGFSLIELIIVIAIMAILVGIVGIQVVPYIENSKEAKDHQVISAILTSATSSFASQAEKYDASLEQNITIQATIGGTCTDVVDDFKTLTNYNGFADVKGKLSSKVGKTITSITITRDKTTGEVKLKCEGDATVTKKFPVISSN